MQGGGFGGGGFLQGALQTAAGVAMGEIAVQSLEGLVHGFGREAGYGSDRALGGFDGGRDFTDNSGSGADLGSGDSYGDRLANADGANDGLSGDIEDRRGDARGFLGDDAGGTIAPALPMTATTCRATSRTTPTTAAAGTTTATNPRDSAGIC